MIANPSSLSELVKSESPGVDGVGIRDSGCGLHDAGHQEGRGARATAGRTQPEEIVLWCHLRIYMSLFQALVSARRRLPTANGGTADALGCAERSA